MTFMCAYTGTPGDCQECGFHDPTYTGFCSHECRQRRADRVAAQAGAVQARRDADDAFGREADRLRSQGYTDREIDALLKDMP